MILNQRPFEPEPGHTGVGKELKVLFIVFFITQLSFSLEKTTVYGNQGDHLKITNPLSSSLNEEQINERNLFMSEDLWSQFSNMSPSSSTNRIRYIKIRGVGERSEYDTVPSNSVGVFYDNIDLSGLSGIISNYDIGDVEVLKGPQSFLYGDSSLGGNILFKSSNISVDNEFETWAELGSQSRSIVGSNNKININENLKFKIGVQALKSNGYFYNEYYKKHTSNRNEVFSNLGIEANFGSHQLKTTSIFGNQNNGNDFWNTDQSYQVQSDRPGEDDQATLGQSFELTGSINKNLKYISILSYSYSDLDYSYDEDWNNNDYWNQVAGWNKNYDYFKSYNRIKQNTHTKFILQSLLAPTSLLTYGVHAYQKKEDSFIQSFQNNLNRNTLSSSFTSNKVAGLISFEQNFLHQIKLDLNTRFERHFTDYSDSNLFKKSLINDLFAFQFNLNKHFKNNALILSISRGFKDAGFNPEINLTPEQQSYDPEYAMNYELAWTHNNKWLYSKISSFYFDRRNHQITTSTQDDPSDPSAYTFFIDNAAKSSIFGVELDSNVYIASNLRLDLTFGYLKAEFDDYFLEGKSYNGRSLAHSPRYTLNVNLNWKLSPYLSLNAQIAGMGKFKFSNTHDQESQPYTTLNSGLNYSITKKSEFTLWAKNILDKRYSQRGFYFGNEPPEWTPTLYTQNAPPFEWGLRFTHKF